MFKIIKWVTIAGALSVANYLVFGKYGIIVPVSISGVLLLGLFLFQNKLLYMPGMFDVIKISPICPTRLKLTLRDTVIPQTKGWRLKMWKLPLQII